MLLSGFKEENFSDYKQPTMTIGFPSCTFKCGKWCQNYNLERSKRIEIDIEKLIQRFINNNITKAIVCAGLEPFDSFDDLKEMCNILRFQYLNNSPIIIYTGYKENEIENYVKEISKFGNIIIKFGRYIPNQQPHFDDVLGINLASDNQYAKFYK